MRPDVSVTTLQRSNAAWLHEVATAYFHELVPSVPPLPMQEIDHWFEDPDCYVLLISVETERAGFSLIDRGEEGHELAELCVLPNWRDAGVGTKAATVCLERFPGPWSLGVASALPGTARFWDRLLPSLPGIEGLARGPALTPYQSHSYTFTIRDNT
ncbi:MAG: GNAT family N-acetyltransferase [Tateyamaria sp.]|jgi:GNAT superfamily N-acetyltransferase|uniref:GNAT family N-acetyltransferase n=1 Tax=Tateyamaria sp. TaxID=1929288 RepID=UPI0032DD689D